MPAEFLKHKEYACPCANGRLPIPSALITPLAPHMRFPRPCKLTVTFGDPIDPAQLPEGLNEKEKRRYILDKIEEFYKEQDAIDKAKHPLPERGAA